jgi:hypothetical protein
LAVASGTTAAVALASTSPKAVRASIVSAALSQHSVRWKEHDTLGRALIESTADVTSNSGYQALVIELDSKLGTINIVYSKHVAYVKGDAFGLEMNIGLTKAQATKYAGKWISITKGDKFYAPTASGLTVASIIHRMTPRGTLRVNRAISNGTRYIAVEAASGAGTKRKLVSIAAPERGKRLPIEAASIDPSHQLVAHIDFSKWNEPVKIKAPKTSTPIATVRR